MIYYIHTFYIERIRSVSYTHLKDEFYENKSSFKAGNSDIDVVYEDENIILINKESGVVVHSDDKGTKMCIRDRLFCTYLR